MTRGLTIAEICTRFLGCLSGFLPDLQQKILRLLYVFHVINMIAAIIIEFIVIMNYVKTIIQATGMLCRLE